MLRFQRHILKFIEQISVTLERYSTSMCNVLYGKHKIQYTIEHNLIAVAVAVAEVIPGSRKSVGQRGWVGHGREGEEWSISGWGRVRNPGGEEVKGVDPMAMAHTGSYPLFLKSFFSKIYYWNR